MYGAKNNVKPDFEKLKAMGLYIHEPGRHKHTTESACVRLAVDFPKRRIRLIIGTTLFETFLGEERYCYAFDLQNQRMYFVPSENGYKFSKASKSSYHTYASGDSFDEIRCLKGCISNLKTFPNRKLNYDKNIGLYYINLIVENSEV